MSVCNRQIRPRVCSRPPYARATLRRGLALLVCCAALACQSSVEDQLEEARTLQELGQVQDAIEVLREVVQREPDNPAANYALGAALLQSGQQSVAVTYLRKAQDDEQQAVPAGLLLASAFLQSENFEESVASATRVLERDPEQVAALRVRANAYLKIGRFESAVEDADQILELEPDDYQGLVLKGTAMMQLEDRLDEAEAVFAQLRDLANESGDPAMAARGCVAFAGFVQEGRQDMERSEKLYDECVESYPSDPLVVRAATSFYDDREKPEKSLEVLRRLVKDAPEDLGVRQQLAQRLVNQGEAEEAEALLVEATELLATAQAWSALSSFHRSQGDAEGAMEAIQRAIELSPDSSDPLLYVLADLQVETDQLDAARATAAQIELPVYQDMVRGRIQLAAGQPAEALESLEAGLRNWPNNPGARFLAGRAALELDDDERALAEFIEATRADAEATDAALVAADIQFRRGNFSDAAMFATRHISNRQTSWREAYTLAARSHAALGNTRLAIRTIATYSTRRPSDPEALATLTSLVKDELGAEEALETLRKGIEAGELDVSDPANQPVLRAQSQLRMELGRGEEALAAIDAALQAHPEAAGLHEMRGRTLLALGRLDAAQGALERALEIDAEYAPAHAALGMLQLQQGDGNAALQHLQRASELEPDEPDYAYGIAQVMLAAGRGDEAEARLREIVEAHPTHAGASNDLAWILADQEEDLDQALEIAQRASRLFPRPEVLDTLGYVRLQRDEPDQAAAAFRRALSKAPDAAGTRYRLGLALAAAGEEAEALEAFRQALESGPFPEVDDARAQIARLSPGASQ